MAKTNRLTPSTETIPFRLSPIMEREYKRRGVFPELRIERALKVLRPATGVFELPIALAEAMLEDVQLQREHRVTLARGVLVAYNCVEDQLRDSINRARGILNEAKSDVVETAVSILSRDADLARQVQSMQADQRLLGAFKQSLEASSARFEVGQQALLYGYEEEFEVEVVEGFGAYKVSGYEHYRLGYVAKHPDGKEYFYPAAALAKLDGRPAHLQLVHSL